MCRMRARGTAKIPVPIQDRARKVIAITVRTPGRCVVFSAPAPGCAGLRVGRKILLSFIKLAMVAAPVIQRRTETGEPAVLCMTKPLLAKPLKGGNPDIESAPTK